MLIQIAFAFSSIFVFAVICAAGMGFAVTIAGITGQVLVQSVIHDEMRGRVMGLWGIIMRGGVPTGSVILGALVGYMGFREGLVVITGIYVLVLLIIIPRSRPFVERMEQPPSSHVELSES